IDPLDRGAPVGERRGVQRRERIHGIVRERAIADEFDVEADVLTQRSRQLFVQEPNRIYARTFRISEAKVRTQHRRAYLRRPCAACPLAPWRSPAARALCLAHRRGRATSGWRSKRFRRRRAERSPRESRRATSRGWSWPGRATARSTDV